MKDPQSEIEWLTDPIVIASVGSSEYTISDWLVKDENWRQFGYTEENWIDMLVAVDEEAGPDDWDWKELMASDKRGMDLLGTYMDEAPLLSEEERKRKLRNAKARLRRKRKNDPTFH